MKLKELEKRLEKEPDNLGLRVTVAGAMREAGRQDEAVELYRSVAAAYRDQGRTQQAIAVCRSILEIAPGDTRCHALLAQLVAQHKGRVARDSAGPYGDDIVLEVGTPPERPLGSAPSGTPAEIPPLVSSPRTITPPNVGRTPTPPRQGARAPTAPPATAKAGVSVPFPRSSPAPRRSSLDETPLPQPMPYHVADPTTKSLKKLSEVDLVPTPDPDDHSLPVAENAPTRPGSDDGTKPGTSRRSTSGMAAAARRISGALQTNDDLSLELDTRQRPRIDSDEIEKVASTPPPTAPVELVEVDDEAATPPPSVTLNMRARSQPPDPHEDEDDGVHTLDTEDDDEQTNPPRDTPLDLMIRTEQQGPLGSAFFQPLPADKRDMVLSRFHKKSVKKGTTVIRQGEVGHSLVVVVKGLLEARVERPKQSIELGAVGTGEFVGEGSLLARTPSPVAVIAATDCDLLLLTPRDFYEIAGAFPALWAELKDVAERRKRELEAHLKPLAR